MDNFKFHLAHWPTAAALLASTVRNAVLSVALSLSFVVLLSFSYRFAKSTGPSASLVTSSTASRYRRLTTLHALATEATQILIAALAIFNTICLLAETGQSFEWSLLDKNTLWTSHILGCLAIATLHIIAIYAVDILEGRILLGRWTHPYGWRCFVVTRCRMMRVKRMWKKPLSSKRVKHLPLDSRGTITTRRRCKGFDCIRVPEKRRASVDYLDLAGSEGFPYVPIQAKRRASLGYLDLAGYGCPGTYGTTERVARELRNMGPFVSGGKGTEWAGKQEVGREQMPTPPESGSNPEQKSKERSVSWAPEYTVISPGGTERRMSLP
jgi:hypothetical protein